MAVAAAMVTWPFLVRKRCAPSLEERTPKHARFSPCAAPAVKPRPSLEELNPLDALRRIFPDRTSTRGTWMPLSTPPAAGAGGGTGARQRGAQARPSPVARAAGGGGARRGGDEEEVAEQEMANYALTDGYPSDPHRQAAAAGRILLPVPGVPQPTRYVLKMSRRSFPDVDGGKA